MNITFINGKGGVGKTTACLLTALALHALKRPLTLRDLDPQNTAGKWWRQTVPEPLEDDGRIVLTDTAPHLGSNAWNEAVQAADLLVLVSSPSPADLWTSRDTIAQVRKLTAGPLLLLFNQVSQGTILTRQLPEIAQTLQIPALKASLRRRQAYQHAVLQGWGTLSHEAKEEVQTLVLEMLTCA